MRSASSMRSTPRRSAVLIIGGDKTGKNSDDFYAAMINKSERLWKQYLAEHKRGDHDEE